MLLNNEFNYQEYEHLSLSNNEIYIERIVAISIALNQLGMCKCMFQSARVPLKEYSNL